MRISIAKNPQNLDAHNIIWILSVLRSAYILRRDQDMFIFYINNYIDEDQFNQLYDPDLIKKKHKKCYQNF